jgi:hypothetical protein
MRRHITVMAGKRARLATRILVAMAFVLGAVLVQAPSASASAGCVTYPEYRNIGHRPYGMTRHRVTQIFDTKGRVYEKYGRRGARDIWVRYEACNHHSFVTINFDNYIHRGRLMRLYKKDWHW